MGTTYSLDLYALMTAPLAFALFDLESSGEDGDQSISALLEAIRRYSDRIDVFCQASKIALPGKYRPIVAHLEASVHEVSPRRRQRVFHPKVWALRFVATGDGPVVFRLLVLSRNLTFDASRDTILLLDGSPGSDPALRERNDPLVRFVRELPRLAVHPLEGRKRSEIEALADELRRVDFELPQGFDQLRFWPLGLGRGASWPFPDRPAERKVVVSPFLSAPVLKRFGRAGTLVSRTDSLDAIAADEITAFGESFVLIDPTAVDAEEPPARGVTEETIAEAPGAVLRGLHAKLYIFDAGWDAQVFTGSANATTAAFGGNVEFLVELVGRKKRCGVDALLDGDGGVAFGALLEPYDPSVASLKVVDESLERALDELCRAIATQPFTVYLSPSEEDDRFKAILQIEGESPLPDEATARCWPISLGHGSSFPLTPAWGDGVEWILSAEGVTAFIGVEVALRDGRRRVRAEFVVRATLAGAPDDRLDRLLVQLLKTRGDVLRYMLFLLAGDDQALASLRGLNTDSGSRQRDDGQGGALDLPLVEWLVRSASRSPERIDHLARLVNSLRATSEGRELLPDGFEEVWDAIWEARRRVQ